jgi:hypothetical protein
MEIIFIPYTLHIHLTNILCFRVSDLKEIYILLCV